MKTNTDNHHFTVVIPTRERSDTLAHALHTCVIQDYENLEILVSDNFSQDRTREVVESFKDSRIRYVNTGKRVSMTDNFEFALSCVKPEGYVIYIGDDDGLLPDAIRNTNAVIAKTGTQVLQWNAAIYWWPTIGCNTANQLVIPSVGTGITLCDSASTIQNVLSFKDPYSVLPVMYIYSAVSYELIRKIKDASGRFYHSMTPDVYSGFAIAGSVDSFVHSKRPYSIAGLSHNSTGASFMGLSLPGSATKFLAEAPLPFHSSLIFCSSINQVVIESFLQAQEHLPCFQEFKLDMSQLLFKMMQEAAPRSQEVYVEIRDVVLRLGQMHNIPKAAQKAIAANPKIEPGSLRKITVRNLINAGLHVTRLFWADLRTGGLSLDCSSLNVNNIYDASLLCDHILKLKDMNIIGFSAVYKSALAKVWKLIFPARSQAINADKCDRIK